MNENVESSIKIYEYNFDKPDLSEEILEHYGIKGMHWGIRRYQNYDGTRIGAKKRVKKSVFKSSKKRISGNREEALKNNDVKYMNEHKSEFSTNEINNALNRINAESRLSDLVNANKTSTKIKNKIKSIINSNGFKLAAGIAIGATVVTAFRLMDDPYFGKPKKTKKSYVTEAINKYNKQNAKKDSNEVLDIDQAIMLFGKKKGDDLAAFVHALGPEVGFLGADKVLRNMGLKNLANDLLKNK